MLTDFRLRFLSVLLALAGLVCVAQAQFQAFPPGAFTGRAALDASGAVATTTWDPANIGTGVVLSNGNLTATFNETFGTHAGVKSISSHSTGKFYDECTVTVVGDGQFGVGNASASNNTPGFVGGSANSTGYSNNGSVLQDNGTDIGGGQFVSFTNGDIIGNAVDFGAALIWFSKNGVYGNSGVPASGTGGKTLTGAGPFFAMSSGNGGGGVCVANFGATAYNTAAPAGFGNW